MAQNLSSLRLGVNIDHVATVRNARGTDYPDVMRAVDLALAGGADGITAHLREDRRHIRDKDINDLAARDDVLLNFEMAATDEMIALANTVQPRAVCLVPENRLELTTEGGLDLANHQTRIGRAVKRLADTGARVSLFIEPSEHDVSLAHELGAKAVELHTGLYCSHQLASRTAEQQGELDRIKRAAALGVSLGLEVHAGHGLTHDNVAKIAAIPSIAELNIGHALVSEALFIGLEQSTRLMRNLIDAARTSHEGHPL